MRNSECLIRTGNRHYDKLLIRALMTITATDRETVQVKLEKSLNSL